MAESSAAAAERAGISDLGRTLYDAAFHTRYFTRGARLQKPRKIPIRVEPKTWFANERTFLAWAGLAVMLGTAATLLSGMSSDPDSQTGPFQEESIRVISLVLAPMAAVILCYGLFTFINRVHFLETKQIGFYDDRIGPICMSVLIGSALAGMTGAAYYDFFRHY